MSDIRRSPAIYSLDFLFFGKKTRLSRLGKPVTKKPVLSSTSSKEVEKTEQQTAWRCDQFFKSDDYLESRIQEERCYKSRRSPFIVFC